MIRLSEKLSRTVAAGGIDCPSGRLSLDPDDLDALRRLLGGESSSGVQVDLKRALNALAQAAEPGAAIGAAAEVLRNPRAGEHARLAAAARLGKGGGRTPEAEEALLEALPGSDGALRREIIKALGRAGSAKSLKALEDAGHADDPTLRRASLAALMVLAARTGDTLEVARARERLGDVFDRRTARPIEGEALESRISALHGETLGLELSRRRGYEFDCDGQRVAVLLSADLDPEKLTEALHERPRVVALVTLQPKEEPRATPRHLVVTCPAERGLEVLVTRTTGELVYAGEARRQRSGMRFSLRDLGGSAPPTTVTGTIAADGLTLEVETLPRRRSREALAVPDPASRPLRRPREE